MKILKKIWIGGILGILLLNSCQNFDQYLGSQFPEQDTSTYIMLDGTFAAPLVDSKITLESLIPTTDTGSFWIETDANNLLHIKLKATGAYSILASDMGINADIPAGGQVPADITLPPAWIDPLMDFDLFNDVPPGIIYFSDPSVTLIIRSNIALQFDLLIDSVQYQNTETNTIKYSDCNESLSFSPKETKEVTFTNTNLTQLSEGLAIYPNLLGVKLGITVPQQSVTETVSTTDEVTVDYLVDLPTSLYIKDLIYTDTTDIDLGGSATEMIKDLTLKMVTKNGMALGATLYIVFTDSTYQDTIATIVEQNANPNDTLVLPFANGARKLKPSYTLEPCTTDISGNTLPAENVVKYISLPQYAIDAINAQKPNRMIIGVKFNTYNSSVPQIVKITSKDYLDLKIGAKIIFEAKTK